MEFAISLSLIVGVATFCFIQVNVTTEAEDTELQKLARIAAGKMIGAVIASLSMYMGLMLLQTYLPFQN